MPDYDAKLHEYRQRILEQTKYVNLQGIPLPRDRFGRLKSPAVPLDDIYIRLQTTEHEHGSAKEETELHHEVEAARAAGGKTADNRIRAVLSEYLYRRDPHHYDAPSPTTTDPEEALRKHKRLVIDGAPGAGKSTLLRYLAPKAAMDRHGKIPILVSLRAYDTALAQDVTLWLSDFAVTRNAGEDRALAKTLHQAIDNKDVLWLFDGLDEASWGQRGKIAKNINELKEDLVVTSRPFGVDKSSLHPLAHFEILPLTPADVDSFLQKWFEILFKQMVGQSEDIQQQVQQRVDALKKQLKEQPRIAALAQNPLMLTFLAIQAWQYPDKPLPQNRCSLYRRNVEELLTQWEGARSPETGVRDECNYKLGQLAGEEARRVILSGFYEIGWQLHLAYHSHLRLREAEAPVAERITDRLSELLQQNGHSECSTTAKEILKFWENAGIVDEWDIRGKKYLACRHLTLQEFAVAHKLAQEWQTASKGAWRFTSPLLHHEAWREPLLLLAAILDERSADKLLRKLLRGKSKYEAFLHRDLRLAAAMLGEGMKAGGRGAAKLVKRLDHCLHGDRRKRIALWSVHVLLAAGLADVFSFSLLYVMAIIALHLFWGAGLRLKRFPQLYACCRLPLRIGMKAANPDPFVAALADVGKPAAKVLERVLHNRDEGQIEVAETLAQRRGVETVEVLRQIPEENQSNWASVLLAAEELAKEGRLPNLMTEEESHRYDTITRIHASVYMKKVINTVRSQTTARLLDQGLDYFYEDLNSEDAVDRASSLLVLADLCHDKGTIVDVIQKSLGDPNEHVRRAAAEALGNLGNPACVPALIEAMNDESQYVCEAVHQAPGKIGSTEAIDALQGALQGDEIAKRVTAIIGLCENGSRKAISILIEALEDSNQSVQRAAAEALHKAIGAKDATDILQETLGRPNPHARQSAASALSKIVVSLPNLGQVRSIARSLWWRLTDTQEVAKAAFQALEAAANRLTILSAALRRGKSEPTRPSQQAKKGWKRNAAAEAVAVITILMMGVNINLISPFVEMKLAEWGLIAGLVFAIFVLIFVFVRYWLEKRG